MRRPAVVTAAELARRTWRELGDDFTTDQAAAVSYYAVLSLLPLTIGLVSVLSLMMEADTVEREVFDFFRTYLPGSEGTLAANVEAVGNMRGLLGVVSVVGLLGLLRWAAVRAFDGHDDGLQVLGNEEWPVWAGSRSWRTMGPTLWPVRCPSYSRC